jgi:hypothetical protein
LKSRSPKVPKKGKGLSFFGGDPMGKPALAPITPAIDPGAVRARMQAKRTVPEKPAA